MKFFATSTSPFSQDYWRLQKKITMISTISTHKLPKPAKCLSRRKLADYHMIISVLRFAHPLIIL